MSIRSPAIFLILWGCGNSAPPGAENGPADPGRSPDVVVGEAIDAVLVEHEVPSLGLTLLGPDGPVTSVVGGVRRIGDSVPVMIDDRYHLGSNTKAMTAALAGTYVDDGTLAWETSMGDVLTEAIPSLHPDYAAVTLAELLSHSSGLVDADAFALLSDPIPGDDVSTMRLEAAKRILARPMPGVRGQYRYSNVGFVVAGLMLERLGGDSWETLLQRRLLEPLDMRSCGFGAPGTPGEVDEPWGHLVEGGALTALDPGAPNADLPSVLAPSGGVHCNLADWAAFVRMIMEGVRGSNDEILSRESIHALLTPRAEDYALGWLVDREMVAYHDGSNERFTSVAFVWPHRGEALLAVTNVGEARGASALERLVDALAELSVMQAGRARRL